VGGGEVGGRLAVTRVVSDASPLIALHQIEQLGLLGTIFGTVLIPPAVAREARTVERPSWILERALTQPLAPAVVRAGLGPGESEEREG
jgi:predicted nucleic acid-binding protein